MADNIILNKVGSIERCLQRISEDYTGHEDKFLEDQMRQDAIILNLQRACELSIDMANHLVKIKKIGVPKDSRSSFDLLVGEGFISRELGFQLKKMVAFRNIAVHQYRQIDLNVTQQIIENHLHVFTDLVKVSLKEI